MTALIGEPVTRVDGRAKVTGAAKYTAEILLPGMRHAVIVGSEIPAGRVTGIDPTQALAEPGVQAVLTHEDLPKIANQPVLTLSLAGTIADGQSFFPMQDPVIHYAGQPVAIVVGETLDAATRGAELVRINYEKSEKTITVIDQGRDQAYIPERILAGLAPGQMSRGDVAQGLAQAELTVEGTFTFAANHHNPIEMSASVASWDGDQLTLWDATHGPTATQMTVAHLLGVPVSRIRVITHFVGGSFGAKAMIWAHPTLAAMVAKIVNRPVKLALTREQMFTSCGLREDNEQTITLGATAEGRLTAIRHHKLSITSAYDDWAEPALSGSGELYACDNFDAAYHLIKGNTMTPTFMRGPGEAAGLAVLECAMDELAEKAGLDPIELRLRNHTDVDPNSGKPYSSKGLKECYERGAELFGWARRDPRPRSQRDGDWLIGTGMATALYPVYPLMNPQRARARLYADGTAVIQIAAADIGTGSATILTQIGAEGLGLPLDLVRVEYGDTDLPFMAASVGSAGSTAGGNAVHVAATGLRDQLIAQAVADEGSPLHGADPATVTVSGGVMSARDGASESYGQMLSRAFVPETEYLGSYQHKVPEDYALLNFGAQFAEVAVDAELGIVRVRRLAGVFAPGRVLNRKTARSQLMGGMFWGMSQALLEATHMDPRYGRWANPSLGDYLVPVNADAPEVMVETVEVEDRVVNPLGIKGIGEIGMVGMAAAIANAVHHATGKRVRSFPITIESLL
ncbi:xanthine dehydrogenase family protein molybdopterin-binding subunit [Nonomuraea typhae]|uniref:xanthine dehydrogenase family protein molybdopterin-binding subunit n=1 Tax=Nonomuraea typhae TaxID=2603600 RepID=UPI0012FAAD80|nr:xanthine dehydrogenase family protein molybdopterin-binding subunit [Nonomuraea typhae]